jgi:hypothetical protein
MARIVDPIPGRVVEADVHVTASALEIRRRSESLVRRFVSRCEASSAATLGDSNAERLSTFTALPVALARALA